MTETRIVLIGCSKLKHAQQLDPKRRGRETPVTPQELYAGSLFKKTVAYAERHSLPWLVLSAEYGVWGSTDQRKPYDKSFDDLDPAERAIWPVSVAYTLLHQLWEPWETNEAAEVLRPAQLTFEIHAGADYVHPLAEILRSVGVKVEVPYEGLAIGKRLAAYTASEVAAAS